MPSEVSMPSASPSPSPSTTSSFLIGGDPSVHSPSLHSITLDPPSPTIWATHTERNEEQEPEYTMGPPIHEVTRQRGYGTRMDMQHRGERGGGDDFPSDSPSTPDEYGSDGASNGGYGGGSGEGRERDDEDEARGRSAFSDDPDTSDDESESSDDSEDDVPLAQRIPGALQAQKSIRIKAKAERDRRRDERQAQKHLRQNISMPLPQPQFTPLADDLTKRLLQVQASESTSKPSVHQHGSSPMLAQRGTNGAPFSQHSTTAHRSRNSSLSQPVPQFSLTTQTHAAPPVQSRNGPPSNHSRSSNTLASQSQTSTPPPPQKLPSSQLDTGQHREQLQSETRRRESRDAPKERARARTLSSSAAPTHRLLQRARTSAGVPPLPMPQEVKKDLSANQHRVFVGDMQRFNTVEFGPQTSAKDVLDLIQAQGELRGEGVAEPGDWMLWELAQDFGMERPLREYELPAEVYASWNSDTRLNAFMIKKTPLATVLARKAMPSSSPRCSGFVQWESKRGKWNKRWMELREHSIWLSKRSDGKDETFLCSLSSFDGYYVSRSHKAPKPFVFAVKSTDNLTLFENPADYLHVFSCDREDGQKWMQSILLARSYVLHKERTILFSAANSSSADSGSARSPPSRPAAPLVNVSVIQSSNVSSTATKGPFQSGSLLAKT